MKANSILSSCMLLQTSTISLVILLAQTWPSSTGHIGQNLASQLLVAAAAAATRASPAFPVDLSESMDQATTFDSGSSTVRRHQPAEDADASNTTEFLASLPILSVGQKHSALFECDTASASLEDTGKVQLLWVKLVSRARNRSSSGQAPENDITLLSHNRRLITPDNRFKVHHRPPHKWVLSIENVSTADDKAFYLCQASGGKTAAANNFIGGARLNVLVPPKLVEEETSPNLVTVSEYEQLKLVCKVIGEPQAQIVWRREDGHSLDGLEQRFKHQLDRSQPHRLISIDSSELLFASARREQAGAYLCIASNGVQPGVSQRMSVTVVKCRASERLDSEPLDCAHQSTTTAAGEAQDATKETVATTTEPPTTATISTTNKPQQQQDQQQQQPQSRAKWKLSSMSTSGAMGKLNSAASANHSSSAPSVSNKRTGQRSQTSDKTRTGRLHANTKYKNDRALAIGANNRRLLGELNGESSGATSPSSCVRVPAGIQIGLAICAITHQIATLAGRNWARVRMLDGHH